MIIGFSLDTNILTGGTPKSTLLTKNIEIYKKYITILKRKKSPVELKLLLTEIVIKEVMEHQKNKLIETYNNLKKNYTEIDYSLIGNLPSFNLEETIKEEENKIKKLDVIKTPINENTFKKLINSAIQKKPPFTKNNSKKGDAGFKDAVIWESILNSAEVEKCDKFYFFTCDSDFWSEKEYLIFEFKQFHKNTCFDIINISGESKKQQVLKHLIEDNDLIKDDIFNLYQEENVINYLHQISQIAVILNSNNDIDEMINVDLTKLTTNNIDIKDVIKDGDNFTVLLRLSTNLNSNSNNPLFIDMELLLKKSNNSFKYQDYKLLDSGYLNSLLTNYMEKINNFSVAISKIANNSMEELKLSMNINALQCAMNEIANQMKDNLKLAKDINSTTSNKKNEEKNNNLL